MNFDMNEGRKSPEWPSNEFSLLNSPTLLVVILAWVDWARTSRIPEIKPNLFRQTLDYGTLVKLYCDSDSGTREMNQRRLSSS